MVNFNPHNIKDYCLQGNNILDASISFSISGANITFTDATTYDAGASEARAAVNITLYDHFGGKIEGQITAADGDDAITIDTATLNVTEGVDAVATVVSNLGNQKDGTIFDLFTLKSSGFLNMEV